MDALSLLCTLHADGPATLQRLRSTGCTSLTALLARDAGGVAAGLGLEPAAARRLLREARILADRLGHEVLEAEEGPPSAPAATAPPVADAGGAQAEDGRSGLDAADVELVARIVSAPGEPAPAAPEAAAIPQEEPATWPAGSPAGRPAEEPAADPRDVEQAAEPAPSSVAREEEPPAPLLLAPDALTVGALPGLDAAMVEDLAAAGVTALGALGAADSLMLTRDLGVTFAQARRLRFLARRAADNVAAARPAPGPHAPERAVPRTTEVSTAGAAARAERAPVAESPVAVPPVAVPPVAAPPVGEPPVARPAQVAPTSAATPEAEIPRPAPRPQPEPAASEDVSGEATAPRRAFWEPRAFLEGAPLEPQGVKVDPAEIERRPRFGDQFARKSRAGVERTAAPSGGRTVLGWNFEIPRPEPEEVPLASFGADGAGAPSAAGRDDARRGAARAAGDEGAGPFA